ncbi:APC family permease [Aneurinibacillus aneurinilyticus]|uniref:APC family permease n=1 Tax=Aneurinibacillus aneurinilyticus TaxID=1391 RepID=UPI002E1E7F82|nr:APC family permease [Aneurinibacillus aneurinilyticus]
MQQSATLKRSLGLGAIVLLGIGYMTPMVVFDTVGIVSGETGGHVPTAYVIALAAMLFTALSYGRMVRVYPSAGSAYTYTQKALNPHLGFMVGWSSLIAYVFLPMTNAFLTQIYMSALFPSVPSWMWVVGFAAFVTIVNAMGMKSTSNLNTLLVVFQFLVIVIFIVLAARALYNGVGYGAIFTIEPFYKSGMDTSGLIAGATLLCFSFLGFDAVTMYSEETPNPVKTIPRAIFLTALAGGVLFITVSYFVQALFPSVNDFHDPSSASPEVALKVAGQLFQAFFLAGALAGTIASGLASHASVSRLLYVMGRDGVIPRKIFGYVHPRLHTPLFNVIIVGIVTCSAILFTLDTATSFVSFGGLVAFTFVNLCVIAHYAVKKKEINSPMKIIVNVIAPVIGAAFVGLLWFNLEEVSFKLGLIWTALGVLYLMYLTKMFKQKPIDIAFDEAEESSYIETEEDTETASKEKRKTS